MRKLALDPAGQAEWLRELAERCIHAIVDDPGAATITVQQSAVRATLTITVHPNDIGIVLGRRGANLDAVRRIVWTACKKTSFERVDVDLFMPSPPGVR